jgi:hypothetical protein
MGFDEGHLLASTALFMCACTIEPQPGDTATIQPGEVGIGPSNPNSPTPCTGTNCPLGQPTLTGDSYGDIFCSRQDPHCPEGKVCNYDYGVCVRYVDSAATGVGI